MPLYIKILQSEKKYWKKFGNLKNIQDYDILIVIFYLSYFERFVWIRNIFLLYLYSNFNYMYKNIVYLRDVIGQPYVGVKFSLDEVLPMLEVWSSVFDKETGDFTKHLIFTNNRNKRDGESYHITLFNAMEWKTILSSKTKEEIDNIFKNIITDIVFEGIGKAIKDGNEAHFIVVTSNQLNLMRTSLGLEFKDLHITLGFDRKDVFGVSKGVDTIFIKL